jgi:hypothetical protein
MQGTMLVFLPTGREPEIKKFSYAPGLDEVKAAIGGGWLEMVPRFETIEHEGELHKCVAFCDEEGKLDYRTSGKSANAPDAANKWATVLWDQALRRGGHPGLVTPYYLSGRVCVLFGDEQFMGSL